MHQQDVAHTLLNNRSPFGFMYPTANTQEQKIVDCHQGSIKLCQIKPWCNLPKQVHNDPKVKLLSR